MGLGGWQKPLAQYATLGLAVLHGLKPLERGRRCSELWGQSRPYKPGQWAHMAEVGWLGGEDGKFGGTWEGRMRSSACEGALATVRARCTLWKYPEPGAPPGDNCNHQEASRKELKLPRSFGGLLAAITKNPRKTSLVLASQLF